MSLCISPPCQKPENPDKENFCLSCGSELLLAGFYRVTKLLSNKGGIADTYEVMHNGTEKVLKVLKNNHPDALRFLDEMMADSAKNRPENTADIIQKLEAIKNELYPPPNIVKTQLSSSTYRSSNSQQSITQSSSRRNFIIAGVIGSGLLGGWMINQLFFPDNRSSSKTGKSQNPISLKPGALNNFSFEMVKLNPQGSIISRLSKSAQFFLEDLGNGIFIEMVSIPGGSFIMGSPNTEKDRSDNEGPQHEVKIAPFFMARTPVTQAQWKAVAALSQINRKLDPDPSYFKGANRPVERVSWEDCEEFCQRLAEKTKRSYNLPSESQWEYACRAISVLSCFT